MREGTEGKYIPEEVKERTEETKEPGKFEKLIKEGKIKKGDFVYRGSMLAIIDKIEGDKVIFLGLDDVGIHGDPDLDESNISEISELEEDFKNGELTMMSKAEADRFIKDEIEDLKNRNYPVVKEKTVQENADIIRERLGYYKSLAELRGIKLKK